MTTYKEIFGKPVKFLSSDPANEAEGQVWYNSTSGTFKTVLATGAWSSAGNLITARSDSGGSGIQTAAAVFGGRSTGVPNHTATEEYNGSGFNTGGAMNTGRQALTGFGTQTASVGTGGYIDGSGAQSLVEEYDGSSWSEVTNMPTTTFGQGSAGTLTSGLVAGGRTPSWVTTTFEYDGTNWTTGGAMGTARTFKSAMTGTQTAAVGFGGDLNPPSGRTDKVEEYNGSSWTEVNVLPAITQANMASGIQTSALTFGGNTPAATSGTTNAFTYDGTNFTATGAMGTAINNGGTLGTASSNSTGLQMGGYGTSTYTNVSQEYNFSATVTTGAAWASGDNINTARYGLRGTGTQTAMVAAGGNIPPNSNTAATEEYNGSSWTSSTSLPAVIQDGNMTGTETASIYAGGSINPGSYPGNTNAYNGSSWTSGGNMNTDVSQYGLTGTSTAAVAFGGYTPGSPGRTADVQNYNGSSWTANPTSLPAVRGLLRTAGTQTATFMAGGNAPPGPQPVTSFSYDGSSFSSEADSIVGMNDHGAWGTANSAYFMGGDQPTGTGGTGPNSSGNFYYNGTSWVTSASITSGGGTFAWAKSSNQNGLIAGGTPGHGNRTEEFTAETTAANVKTLTSS